MSEDERIKIVISGSRSVTFDPEKFEQLIFDLVPKEYIKDVLHGDCPTGVDACVPIFCRRNGMEEQEKPYPANWDKFGKRAGFIRNSIMAKVGDFLIAFWDGESSGTKHMIGEFERSGKPYIIYRCVFEIKERSTFGSTFQIQ